MGKLGLVGIAVVVSSLFVASRSEAVVLTYVLEGTITQKTDRSHLVDFVSVGDPVTYTVLVDTDTPNVNSTPGFGFYEANAASLRVGTGTFVCDAPLVEVIADWSENPTSMFNVEIKSSFWGAPVGGYYRLKDSQKHALPSSELPTVPYDLNLFVRSLSLVIDNPNVYGDYSSVIGSFDSFTIVPEPASLCFLLLAGLVMITRTHSGRRLG